eukprot:TRINITY_DN43415_c0_g1_i1.p1 TRINITY_DN43415_c0_g1~~TRINITY_DN43415_c0_g1_i1.p1  ORF type:complete len:168 (+),score=16.30 TRINITY_DN43415_c0_g1_i1:22-525(+)
MAGYPPAYYRGSSLWGLPSAGGLYSSSAGDLGVGRSFGFLQYADLGLRQRQAPVVNGITWDDSKVLTVNHFHHGDHHHHHHQRQVHHFHDLHLMGTADETLDLRGTPQVQTSVIAGDAAPQLRLRPDTVGLNAFVDLNSQIGGAGPSYLDPRPLPSALPVTRRRSVG